MRRERHSANQHSVIIFPPVPLSLSLWGQVQNHVPCSASSLALFHLFKGWAWILTFCKEEQNSSTNLEINCWHFSPLTLLMCMKKNIYIYLHPLRRGEQEKSSPAGGQPGDAEHHSRASAACWLLLMREWKARWDSQSPLECRRHQKSPSSCISLSFSLTCEVYLTGVHMHGANTSKQQHTAFLISISTLPPANLSDAKGTTGGAEAIFDVYSSVNEYLHGFVTVGKSQLQLRDQRTTTMFSSLQSLHHT